MIGREQLERLWANLLALGPKRLMAMAIIGATVFVGVGATSYLLSRPELETLYTGLSPQDATRIGAALGEAGIHFDVNAEGTKVMVRPSQTAAARALLAEKGLPSNSTAGYELFDKLGSIGLTSFMQEITRVRALEGEIARTIQAVSGVKAARVHLVLPDAGSFRRSRQTPSASVVIRTDTAGDRSSAIAIRHLVAAAVPGMVVDQVTVLSTDGSVLAAAGDASSATPARLVDLEKTFARDLQASVSKTLVPYLGLGNFEVSASARLNTDRRQTNETSFDPESRVERSVRTVRETGNSQNQANRTPVTVEQNMPLDQPAARPGDVSTRSNDRREELTNFELNSKTTSTVSEGYRIEAMTVAVVINRKPLLASLGEGAGEEALNNQLKEIERLIATSAGISAERGDRVTVAAVDFFRDGEAMEPLSDSGIRDILSRQAGTIINAFAVLGVMALVIWFGLKPALRAVLQAPVPALAADGPPLSGGELKAAGAEAAGAFATHRLAGGEQPNLISDLQNKLGNSPQKRFEQMVDYDEEQAAAILKQWMREARRA